MSPSADCERLYRRQLRFGWWSLLAFIVLGLVLESMHGFKVGWYVDPANEVRRMMWTLAHAHGTLLACVQILFALTVRASRPPALGRLTLAAVALRGAGLLVPGGFLLGGLFIHGGDPGVGIVLLPVGAALLVVGVAIVAQRLSSG